MSRELLAFDTYPPSETQEVQDVRKIKPKDPDSQPGETDWDKNKRKENGNKKPEDTGPKVFPQEQKLRSDEIASIEGSLNDWFLRAGYPPSPEWGDAEVASTEWSRSESRQA